MDCWTNYQEDCRLQHTCILLEHANHKELLTSTNNDVKTLELLLLLPSGRQDVVLTYYTTLYHGIRNIYQNIYIFRKGCNSARRIRI